MSYEFSLDIIHAERGWHALEANRAEAAEEAGRPLEHMPDIVDIDVLKPVDVAQDSFSDRAEVRSAFEAFLDDPRLNRSASQEYIHRRLVAHLLHLELLEGGKVDVYEHARLAMNVELEPVDESKLDDYQQALDDQLTKHDLGFDKKYEGDFAERWLFQQDDEELKQHLIRLAQKLGILAVGEDPESSLLIPEIVQVDAPWTGFCGTNQQGLPYRQLNNHPRHMHSDPRLAAIMVHEAKGHAEDYLRKKDAILKGEMDPIQGVTTYHTPENTTLEATAQGREQQFLRAVRGQDAWRYHLQADYHRFIEMAWTEAHIRINTGDSLEAVTDYMERRSLPFEPRETIEKELVARRDDPTWRGYFTSYDPSLRIIDIVLDRAVDEQEQFFTEIGRYSYSQSQMRDLLLGQTAAAMATI